MLSASVTVNKQLISSIGKGILVFAAIAPDDTAAEVDALVGRVLKMRLWDDDAGGRVCLILFKDNIYISNIRLILKQWKRNVIDINGDILCGKLVLKRHAVFC